MSEQSLTIDGTTKKLEILESEELSAMANGLTLRRYGPLVYTVSNGGAASGWEAKDVTKLMPPSDGRGNNSSRFIYGGGMVDSWYANVCGAMTVGAKNDTITTTSNGIWRNWDNTDYSNSRVFQAAILGDTTAFAHTSLTINGTTKDNIVLSAESNTGSVMRYASRGTLTCGTQNKIGYSKWGDFVVVNFAGITHSGYGDPVQIAEIPSTHRPPYAVTGCLINHGTNISFTAIIGSDGKINIYNPGGTTLNNAYGCFMYKNSTSTPADEIFLNLPLTIESVTKNLCQVKNTSYECRKSTATNASGVAGTLNLYKIGKFVCGNAVSFNTGQGDAALNGFHAFTLPTGWRPKDNTCYNTGAGWQYNISAPYAGLRLATNIMGGTDNNAGKVLLWSNGGSTYNCGIAFYFETE